MPNNTNELAGNRSLVLLLLLLHWNAYGWGAELDVLYQYQYTPLHAVCASRCTTHM